MVLAERVTSRLKATGVMNAPALVEAACCLPQIFCKEPGDAVAFAGAMEKPFNKGATCCCLPSGTRQREVALLHREGWCPGRSFPADRWGHWRTLLGVVRQKDGRCFTAGADQATGLRR